MAHSNTIRVGHIPALTWNSLKMNEGVLPEVLSLNTGTDIRFKSLPEGVTHKKMTMKQAGDWLLKNAPGQEAERFVAGKVPIYHPQTFGTGLGAEFEEFMNEACGRCDLLEAAEGVKVKEPLSWHIDFNDGNRAASSQIIHLGKNASMTLVLDYASDREAAGLAALSTRIVLERGASLTFVTAQTLGRGFLHLSDIGASQAEGSHLEIVELDLGGKDCFTGIQAEQMGRGAVLKGHMGYMAVEDQTVDINYNVVQRGKKTVSRFDFDGVLSDRGKKSFRGTIDFRNGACGAVGNEQESVLLMSPDVINKTLPIILCEEEDVEGAHGATIGRLSEDMLFYMTSRGIDRKTAERIIVRARLDAVAAKVPVPALKEKLTAFIEETFSDEHAD